MRIRRFKVDDLTGSSITLAGQEATHALRVLRLKKHDQVILFDGHGKEALGQIVSTMDDVLTVAILECKCHEPAAVGLTLAVATPKGERADWLVEKCAELGVVGLWWLQTERGVVCPGEGKMGRWRRKAQEAAKQAGLSVELKLEEPRSIEEVRTAAADHRLFYGEPHGQAPSLIKVFRQLVVAPLPQSPLVFIGPEGGFTVDEYRRLEQARATPVCLAPTILRTETAAMAAAACWAVLSSVVPQTPEAL